MKQVDWAVPEPREGLAGFWDRFAGPGATGAEIWFQMAGALVIGAVATWYYFAQRGLEAGWAAGIVLVVLAIDLGGGVATNATGAAKRWYHRAEQGWRQHMGFVAMHGVHVGLVAWLLVEDGLVFFILSYGMLLGIAAVILAVPLYLQRPVAMVAYALVLLAAQTPVLAPPGLEWFVPLLFLKLIVSHLLFEVRFSPQQVG